MDSFRPIPKIIHVFEMDGKESSHQVRLRSLHPDWDIQVWSPNRTVELTNFSMITKDITDDQRLDILKMETLVQFGGVWVDKGINLETPLDDFVRNTDHLLLELAADRIDNRMLGFCPNHGACWSYILKLQPRYFYHLERPDYAFDPSWIREIVEERLRYSLVLPYRCVPLDTDEDINRQCRGFLGTRTADERYT